jgi:hypothetical protein
MSFFDKVTKAVGDVVDKGKKDVDQFMRIQKINGEISAIETKVAGLKTKIQQNSQEAGAKAIELLKAGSFSNPDLQVFVETRAELEQQIAAEQSAIAAKKADIEKIKEEHEAEHAAAAPTAAPAAAFAAAPAAAPAAAALTAEAPAAPPPLPAQPAGETVAPPPPVPTPAAVVPPVPPDVRTCSQCGKPVAGGAFCPECGAKVG